MKRDELLNTAGETLAYAEDFLETKIELFKLGMVDKGTRIGADVISGYVVAKIAATAMLFLSLALAIWLGQVVDSVALGFVIVGGTYLLFAVALFALRRRLLAGPILKTLISASFKDKSDSPNPQSTLPPDVR